MAAPEQVRRLVEQFAEHYETYHAPGYNETQVRREFIDPLFEALGWDVANRKGYAEAHKEVVHEDAIRVGGRTKAPDYCFRAGGGVRTFFVEAKKPAVDVGEAIDPAFQLRRYAWSAKLPLSILTDFEEFSVYDCRIRPDKIDKASTGRILYLQYTEYLDRWDELVGLLSPEAVRHDAIGKYLGSKKAARGTAEVDAAFLAEIEGWRDVLAHNLALRNESLSQRDLNFAVQRTIDRVIFLRICEDRGIEPYGTLQPLENGSNVYARLGELFRRADDRYNSGLFYFSREKGRRDPPDELTLGLAIDDRVLKDILRDLYYPDSPYEFSVLPAEILGQVYEQFLGKVIRLTKGHQARVEEKPEVKKAGGVYYTPTYIVDYIVKHTVGKLVEGKTPQEIGGLTATWKPSKGARPLAVLDPACGSGSFLLGAYQFLLDWHRDWYENDGPEKHARGKSPRLYRSAKGPWRLTTAERKRILLAHIHGVDIDSQAVEVTKLSLLLKVLEGESGETLELQRRWWHERALPDLSGNIKCGNSLIGQDFYKGRQKKLFDEEEERRINAFDWEVEFPEVFRGKDAGFDVVIGNPPYGARLSDLQRNYLQARHSFVSDFESSQYFIGKATALSRTGGHVSFIVPNTLFLNVYAQTFRSFVASHFHVERLADLAEIDVFSGATVRTVICFLARGEAPKKVDFVSFRDQGDVRKVRSIGQRQLMADDSLWIAGFRAPGANALTAKLLDASVPLGQILEVSQGLIPYDRYRGHDEETIRNRIWHSDHRKDKTYKRELRGGDVKRYHVVWNGRQWISYGPWLGAPRKPEFFTQPRLLFREITDPKSGLLHVACTDEEFYNNPGIINCIRRDNDYSLYYVLGVVASKLIAYFHYASSPKARKGVFPKILVTDVRKLPVRKIDFNTRSDRTHHDHMVALVETMLKLHEELPRAKEPHRRTVLERRIEATDREIDQLVYELYGLSDKEIAIVEQSGQ